MDRQKAAEFFDKEIKSRFPNFRPGEELIWDWLDWLKPFDYDVAKQAMKQHTFESRLTYPVLKDFYTKAKKIQQEKYPESDKPEYSMRWTKYQIRCVAGKREGFIKIVAIQMKLAGNVEAERMEAENLANFFKGRHGGSWVVEDLKAQPNENYAEKIPDDLVPIMSG